MAPTAADQDPKSTHGSDQSPGDSTPSTAKQPQPLTGGDTLARSAGVGILILGVVAAFLYLGGWFSPNKLTPSRFVNGFEQVNGKYSGFRRNHAKGLPVSGYFDSNGNGTRLSKAIVFQGGRVPVIGRFSLGGGDPYQTDEPTTVRGLGLQFSLSDGEQWRTAMVNLPVFPFKDAQAFYDNMIASKPDPTTHKPDPAKIAAFFASNPESARAIGIIKSQPPSSGFDNSTFHSLNAFRFTDAGGTVTSVRWMLVPVQPFQPVSAAGAAAGDKNFLFDALIASIHQHPLQWHLIIIVGQSGDPTDDATVPWPEGREQVDVGTLTLDSVESEETSPARDINFDPLVLPEGIKPSDDPLLSARSAVYSQSFTRRAGEKKEPSAISPAEVQK
jgi:catalase